MLLTTIIHGRADNYFGNFLWRIQTALNKIGRNTDDDTEIILLDWGSEQHHKLVDHIAIEEATTRKLRCLYVDPATARSVGPDAAYSSSHAVNCAVRRSRGKHILACDSDVYWTRSTSAMLYDGMRHGRFENDPHGHPLDECFFWSARRHIPQQFNARCPTIEEIDAHIAANWQNYQLDKPDPSHFQGATCALFATRAMWHDCTGLDERMIHWGVNDIDIHERLKMKYRYGGDVDDFGLKFFHLEHYRNRSAGGELNRPANTYGYPVTIKANQDNWGLRDQPVYERSKDGTWHHSPPTL